MADKWAENNPSAPPELTDEQACAGFVPGGPCGTEDAAGLPMTSGFLNAAICWIETKLTDLILSRVPNCPNGGPWVLSCVNGSNVWTARPPVVSAVKNAAGEITALTIDGVDCPIATATDTGGGGDPTGPTCGVTRTGGSSDAVNYEVTGTGPAILCLTYVESNANSGTDYWSIPAGETLTVTADGIQGAGIPSSWTSLSSLPAGATQHRPPVTIRRETGQGLVFETEHSFYCP